MKFYVLDHGRPCGIEPTLYFYEPKFDDDNCFAPSVEEFNTEFEALAFIRRHSDFKTVERKHK